MNATIEELFADPCLPEKMAVLEQKLVAEREQRARFYAEITPDMKAEFINGEVVIHSPAREKHNATRQRMQHLLWTLCHGFSLGLVSSEKALCTFPRNDYEPDVVFFGPEKTALIKGETLQYPVPDFVCEVLSDSTEHRDRGVKFVDYAAHGVREYWVLDPDRRTVEQYVAREERFELLREASDGEIQSAILPEFRIPVVALFDDRESLRALRDLLD